LIILSCPFKTKINRNRVLKEISKLRVIWKEKQTAFNTYSTLAGGHATALVKMATCYITAASIVKTTSAEYG